MTREARELQMTLRLFCSQHIGSSAAAAAFHLPRGGFLAFHLISNGRYISGSSSFSDIYSTYMFLISTYRDYCVRGVQKLCKKNNFFSLLSLLVIYRIKLKLWTLKSLEHLSCQGIDLDCHFQKTLVFTAVEVYKGLTKEITIKLRSDRLYLWQFKPLLSLRKSMTKHRCFHAFNSTQR
jgi:hypothetical protein